MTSKIIPIVKYESFLKEKNSRTTTSSDRKLLGKTTVPTGIHTSAYCIIMINCVLEFFIYFFTLTFNLKTSISFGKMYMFK